MLLNTDLLCDTAHLPLSSKVVILSQLVLQHQQHPLLFQLLFTQQQKHMQTKNKKSCKLLTAALYVWKARVV